MKNCQTIVSHAVAAAAALGLASTLIAAPVPRAPSADSIAPVPPPAIASAAPLLAPAAPVALEPLVPVPPIEPAGLRVAQAVASSADVRYPRVATPRVATDSSYVAFSRQHSAARTLVISSKTIDPKTMAEIEEDLNVMSYLFNDGIRDELGGNDPHRAMGIVITAPFESRSPNALYLENYGALFLMDVNFPLLPPPAREQQPEKKEPAEDSAWERAKRELFGPGDAAARTYLDAFVGADDGDKQYDPKKVEGLKQAIVEGLKSAANIRYLKADEFVTVTVLGSEGGEFAGRLWQLHGGGGGGQEIRFGDRYGQETSAIGRSGRGSTLTVRAKKADIDAFAKGKLDLDGFKQRVTTQSYLGAAGRSSSSGTARSTPATPLPPAPRR